MLWSASKNEGEIIITGWLESLFFEGSLLDKRVNTRIINFKQFWDGCGESKVLEMEEEEDKLIFVFCLEEMEMMSEQFVFVVMKGLNFQIWK